MSGVLKSLFGGSSISSTSSSGPVDVQAEEFKGLRGGFAEALRGLLGSGGTPEYGGPLSAPLGQREQEVLNYLQNNTGGGSASRGYLDRVLGGDFLPGGSGSNPFLRSAIEAAQRPTLEGLEETLGRVLPGRFTSAGQFIQSNANNSGGSSAFDRAAAIATRGAASALGDIATNISFGNFEGERNRQQQAVTLNQEEVNTTLKNLQAQALPRLIQENGIDRALQLFQQRTQGLLQLLQLIGGVTAPAVGTQSSAQSRGSSERGVFPALFPKGI